MQKGSAQGTHTQVVSSHEEDGTAADASSDDRWKKKKKKKKTNNNNSSNKNATKEKEEEEATAAAAAIQQQQAWQAEQDYVRLHLHIDLDRFHGFFPAMDAEAVRTQERFWRRRRAENWAWVAGRKSRQ